MSGCPIIVGENVALVGYEMGPGLIGRIVQHHRAVTGVSYTASGGLSQLTRTVTELRDRVQVRTGWLHHMANMAALGGAGVLCFEGNVVPGLVAAVWRAATDGTGARPPIWAGCSP